MRTSMLVNGEGESMEMEGGEDDDKTGQVTKQISVDLSIYSLTFTSMISEANVKYQLKDHVEDYFFKATMIFFIQMLIITFIAIAALTNTDGLEYVQPTTTSLTLRLLCCYLFHLSNYGDIADAFRRLKYLKENPDKFSPDYVIPAFLITQFQFWASFSAETVNILFLTRQTTLIDLMMNYVAFEGISAMDNLYCETIRNMKVTDAIPIDGKEDPERDQIFSFVKGRKDFTFANPINSEEWVHKAFMKFVHIWFVLIKLIYKGIYFYLFPYLIVPLSYYVFDWTKVTLDE